MSSSFSSTSDSTAIAQRIWDRDETVYEDLDHIVEWIGDGKPASNAILQSYISRFDFKDLYLEQAFRNLCSKLSLKGETQQIDRILLQFSERYFECNPRCIFGTPDAVHAIVYSLLLLNTDLHVAQGDYKKMSRSAFVKNTMSAIYAQLETPPPSSTDLTLDDRSGVSFSSTAPTEWSPLQRTPSNQSALSNRSFNTNTPDSSRQQYAFGSISWQYEVKNVLKQMYSNVRHTQINNPSTTISSATPSNNHRMSTAFKRGMGTIIWKNSRESMMDEASIASSVPSVNSSSVMQYQTIASHLHNVELPTSFTSSAPYYKEGMVSRKHVFEKTNQKARHRDWKDCFMLVDKSQLRMYKLDSTTTVSVKRHTIRNTIMPRSASPCVVVENTSQQQQMSSSCDTTATTVGGGDWLANAQLLSTIDLKHTLASVLPSGYNRQRPFAFTLQQSNGAVFLFQVGSGEQVQEWVATCNYWAARESKEPLAEGVSSMEYGWGDCLNNSNNNKTQTLHINEWEAPTPMMSSSLLGEAAQFEAFTKYVEELSAELDQHRDIKPKIEHHFHNSKLKSKVMSNWEAKSHYLLHEIIKYQNYCNSIETSLELQTKVMLSLPTTTHMPR